MSAIGDYVHAHADNQRAQGISRQIRIKQGKRAHDAKPQQVKTKNFSIAPSFSKAELMQLEDYQNNLAIALPEDTELQQIIFDNLGKTITEEYIHEMEQINWDTLTSNLNTLNTMGHVRASKAAKYRITIEDATKRLNKFETIFTSLKSTLTTEQGKEISRQLSELKQLYKELYGLTYEAIVQDIGRIPAKQNQSKVNWNKTQEFRSKLNALIDAYAKYPPRWWIEGTLFEKFLAAGAYGLAGTAYNSYADALKTWSGQSGENLEVEVNPDMLFGNRTFKDTVSDNLATAEITAQSSYGKSDVQIKWLSKDLNISAKSVELKDKNQHWVTLVSGTPLLNALASIQDNELVNHYLNVQAGHSNKDGKYNGQRIQNTNAKEIREEIKRRLFQQGLSGNRLGRTSANIFVVHDKRTNKIKFFDMAEIVNDLDTLNQALVQFNGINMMEQKAFSNKMVQAFDGQNISAANLAMIRIGKLLAELRQIKIKVAQNLTLAKFNDNHSMLTD